MLKDVDQLRRETDEFTGPAEELEVTHGEMGNGGGSDSVADEERGATGEGNERTDDSKPRPEEVVSDQLPTESQGASADRPQEQQGHGDPEQQRPRPARTITFINGAKFYLGELLPWKGVLFQVIQVKGQGVVLQGIDLTGKEQKRLAQEATKRHALPLSRR